MQRPSRHVVCLVVLIVIARRHAWVIGTGVASGLDLFHVTPSFMGARLAARRSRHSLSRDLGPRGRRSDTSFEFSAGPRSGVG